MNVLQTIINHSDTIQSMKYIIDRYSIKIDVTIYSPVYYSFQFSSICDYYNNAMNTLNKILFFLHIFCNINVVNQYPVIPELIHLKLNFE